MGLKGSVGGGQAGAQCLLAAWGSAGVEPTLTPPAGWFHAGCILRSAHPPFRGHQKLPYITNVIILLFYTWWNNRLHQKSPGEKDPSSQSQGRAPGRSAGGVVAAWAPPGWTEYKISGVFVKQMHLHTRGVSGAAPNTYSYQFRDFRDIFSVSSSDLNISRDVLSRRLRAARPNSLASRKPFSSPRLRVSAPAVGPLAPAPGAGHCFPPSLQSSMK